MSEPWAVPATWQWVKAGDVAEVIGGGTPSTADPANFGGTVPWVTPADMSSHKGKSISGGARTLSNAGLLASGARWLPAGTVLFSSRAPIGYCAIAARPLTTNQGFKSFVPTPELSSDYLLHWLRSARSIAEELASGTTFLELSGAKAAQLPIPLAPASEQERIVAALEPLLDGLDAGSAELIAGVRRLAQYRQSLLKSAVEGELTAEWRAQNPPHETGAELLARILRERRTRWEALQLQRFKRAGKRPPAGWQSDYVQPTEPVATGLPHLPVNWVWASLDQLLVSMRSGTAVTSGRQPTGHPVLKSSAVRQGSIDFNALNYLDSEQSTRDDNYLELGDLFITRLSGSLEYVGCCAVVRELPAARVQYPDRIFCGKAVLPDRCLTEQIAICFQAPLVRSLIETAAKSTAGHKRISLSDLPRLPIALPPASEMTAIIELVEAAVSASFETDLSVQASLRLAAAQRQNILRAAFSGQLVPQDPADEPASELLARIRAERARQPAASKARRPRTAKGTA
ncbi:MAG: restriction endonuclease subunit S [Burkholderiaceae bacterium]|nr:restriction endonuclease subunit S [Burkholderiaceae bacterium]